MRVSDRLRCDAYIKSGCSVPLRMVLLVAYPSNFIIISYESILGLFNFTLVAVHFLKDNRLRMRRKVSCTRKSEKVI